MFEIPIAVFPFVCVYLFFLPYGASLQCYTGGCDDISNVTHNPCSKTKSPGVIEVTCAGNELFANPPHCAKVAYSRKAKDGSELLVRRYFCGLINPNITKPVMNCNVANSTDGGQEVQCNCDNKHLCNASYSYRSSLPYLFSLVILSLFHFGSIFR